VLKQTDGQTDRQTHYCTHFCFVRVERDVSGLWVELHYSLLQPPLRPTNVGCEVLFFLCIWICCIRRSLIILVCVGLSVLFVLFCSYKEFCFRSGGVGEVGELGLELGGGWGVCRRLTPGKLRSSVVLWEVVAFETRGDAREALECTSAYLRQYSALRMYDP
jgi:hypothetical protein